MNILTNRVALAFDNMPANKAAPAIVAQWLAGKLGPASAKSVWFASRSHGREAEELIFDLLMIELSDNDRDKLAAYCSHLDAHGIGLDVGKAMR